VRYVGFTSLKLNRRYNNHLSIAKKRKSLKDKWVNDLVTANHKLVLTVLKEDIETKEEACASEIQFISEYSNAGIQLYNTTKGGMGTSGMLHSEETKIKQSIANLGKPFIKIKSFSDKKKSQLRLYYYNRKALKKETFEKQKIFHLNSESY
jgi:polyribonucleotide nucleotidyltransferase